MTESSDAIARRFRAKDAGAFAAVYDRYRGLVHAVAVMELADPAEAEDVTQEVFRRAFAAADQLEDPSRLKPWLLSIARRYLLDKHKRARFEVQPLATRHQEIPDTDRSVDPARGAIESEWRHEVRRAIAELPEAYQLPVALRVLEDKSYREIADVLTMPLASVKNAIARGGRSLLERLRRHGSDSSETEL
jgi:RNA polymerase sigma-70 factor (ECF subfamily)